MQEDILVSVYCLAYNHEKYIRNCLDGFINQKTNFKYEVIVHDDASTDATASIIQEYADKYPNVIKAILQKDNQYSQGIKITDVHIMPKCSGKYIAICEGDDYWCDNTKLQKQVDVMEANPKYVACVHQTKCVNCRTGEESLISPYERSCVVDTEKVLSRGGAVYQTSSLLYRKELRNQRPAFCFVSKQIGDYPFAIHLALSGQIYFIKDVMSVYRMYTEGSWSVRNEDVSKFVENQKELVKILTLVDEYSYFKYHTLLDKRILEHEYQIWKHTKDFGILKNKRFQLLPIKKKIKLFFRVLFKF